MYTWYINTKKGNEIICAEYVSDSVFILEKNS